MKLRNKKSGEIIECPMIRMSIGVCDLMRYEFPNSLADLNEEWEDYKPKEPLIKDEKIRKMLRSYAEVFHWDRASYSSVNNAFENQGDMLFVPPSYELERLDKLGYLSIDELCGPSDSEEEK